MPYLIEDTGLCPFRRTVFNTFVYQLGYKQAFYCVKTMSFSNIPNWARWVAMDEDGLWWCYEAEPHQYDKEYYENEVGRSQKIPSSNYQNLKWQNSLKKVDN